MTSSCHVFQQFPPFVLLRRVIISEFSPSYRLPTTGGNPQPIALLCFQSGLRRTCQSFRPCDGLRTPPVR